MIDLLKAIPSVFGLRISRRSELFKYRLVRQLDRLSVTTVIDVGANLGQFYFDLRSAGFGGDVISFEPLPDAHRKLVSLSKQHPRWVIYERVALGSAEGASIINIANNSASSSLRAQTSLMVGSAPYAREVGRHEVMVTTLDKAAAPMALSSCALKIDTQGFELEVLKGAARLLNKVKLVSLELSLSELYEGQALYYEIDEYLRSSGFHLIDLHPGFKKADTGELLEYDAIYERCNRIS